MRWSFKTEWIKATYIVVNVAIPKFGIIISNMKTLHRRGTMQRANGAVLSNWAPHTICINAITTKSNISFSAIAGIRRRKAIFGGAHLIGAENAAGIKILIWSYNHEKS